MFSLLQQAAPDAVQETTTTVIVTPAAPAGAVAATETHTTTVTVPLTDTTAAGTQGAEAVIHGTDAMQVPV
ncbi:MAG TPA: hypothetical protein PLL33_06405, partial [Paracoccus sp. (in: a-proteobacteria)]|nr:hypothetical protein [Paracoccus sp. (in: a-proteobacteria)]